MKHVIMFAIVLSWMFVEASAQEARGLWRFDAPAKIGLYTTVGSGDLFVSTDSRTMLLSGENGRIIWQRDDLVACEKGGHPARLARIRLEREPFLTCQLDGKWERMSVFGSYLRLQSDVPDGTPGRALYARCGFLRSCLEAGSLEGAPKTVVGGSYTNTHSDARLVLVSLETGQDAFDSVSAGLKRVDGTCLLEANGSLIIWEERDDAPATAVAFDLSAGRTLWTQELPLSKEIGCVALGGAGLWLAYGKTERGNRRVFGMEHSGRRRWESAELAKNDWGKLPVAVADSDSTAVLHVDESGPVKINLETGAVQWRASVIRGENPAGDSNGRNPRPQPIVRYGDHIFIVQKKTMAALHANTGAVVWKKEFDGPVMIMPVEGDGVLVREYDGEADSKLHLLQKETGKVLWSTFIGSRRTGWVIRNDHFYYVTTGKLRSLALRTGEVKVLGAVDFLDEKSPGDLDVVGNGLLVLSSQNAVVFEPDGSLRYQRSYEAPGLSFTEKLMRIAAATAATELSRRSARARARAAANTAAYLRGGSVTFWYTYEVHQPRLDVRLPATKTAEQFLYMSTEESSDTGAGRFSIVQLDKTSGVEIARLRVKARQPNYTPHPMLPIVFVRTDESTITAYTFGAASQ